MRLLSSLTLILVVAGSASAVKLHAQSDRARTVESHKLERWRELRPETRRKIRTWGRTLAQLPEERRRAVLERVHNMSSEELRQFGQRMKQYRLKPKTERQQLTRRAHVLRHIERTLSSEERAELRRLTPGERQRRIKTHAGHLMKRFKRALTHRQRDELREADRSVRRQRFLSYLESTRAERAAGRQLHRPAEENRRANLIRLRRLRTELEQLPVRLRRQLLRDPQAPSDVVPDRLRRELEALTPRERSQLRRIDGRGSRGMRDSGDPERRTLRRPEGAGEPPNRGTRNRRTSGRPGAPSRSIQS